MCAGRSPRVGKRSSTFTSIQRPHCQKRNLLVQIGENELNSNKWIHLIWHIHANYANCVEIRKTSTRKKTIWPNGQRSGLKNCGSHTTSNQFQFLSAVQMMYQSNLRTKQSQTLNRCAACHECRLFYKMPNPWDFAK